MYESLKKLEEQGILNTLIKQGIISVTLAGHKYVYEIYMREKEKGLSTTEAVAITSDLTKHSESVIYKIMRKMLA